MIGLIVVAFGALNFVIYVQSDSLLNLFAAVFCTVVGLAILIRD